MNENKPIVIFDGVCNFCNWWVDFIMTRDKKGRFLFTANQDPAGQAILEANGITTYGDPDSVYLFYQGKLYSHSSAAVKIAGMLRFPWSLMIVFIVVPRFIRDAVYSWVAKNRYKWFGKSEACRLPQPGEIARFLRSEDDLAQAAPRFALRTS